MALTLCRTNRSCTSHEHSTVWSQQDLLTSPMCRKRGDVQSVSGVSRRAVSGAACQHISPAGSIYPPPPPPPTPPPPPPPHPPGGNLSPPPPPRKITCRARSKRLTGDTFSIRSETIYRLMHQASARLIIPHLLRRARLSASLLLYLHATGITLHGRSMEEAENPM